MTSARDMYEFDDDEAAFDATDPATEMESCVSGAEFLLNDDEPFEPVASQQQIDAILELLGDKPKRVVEFGSGAGRVLVPVAAAGHHCMGIDIKPDSIARCRESLQQRNANAGLIACDFLRDRPGELESMRGGVDAALCVGNTFMTIVDVDDAVRFLEWVKTLLAKNGILLIDAIPQEYWPELAEGNWQAGVSDDDAVQLVWAADDAVFALRTGKAIDTENWEIKRNDRKLRLWTDGCLRLAARSAGLSGPEQVPGANALIFRLCP